MKEVCVKNFGEMASFPDLDYNHRGSLLNKETSDSPQVHESECPGDAGAPLFLISTLDDSDDEPGVENTHLVRKQFPKMKPGKQVCPLARGPARQKEADLSRVLLWKTLESWKEGRKTLEGWVED